MKFKLTEIEIQRAKKFYNKCKKKTKEDVRISYYFYPTGIGNIVKVRSETLGIEEDITDLSNWQFSAKKG
jgi:hypothetical protein